MITEILIKINEQVNHSIFEITKFELGVEPYLLLKEEIESMVSNIKVDIDKVNHFNGIPVFKHNSNDAILFSIQLRSMNHLTVPVFPIDRIENGLHG